MALEAEVEIEEEVDVVELVVEVRFDSIRFWMPISLPSIL